VTASPILTTSKHLLLVDDDRLVLSTLSVGLEQAGYQVGVAESAEEAEAQLAGGLRPDLAVLDMRMPGRDGLFLAERLRELDHIPFMVLSAYSDSQMVAHATRHGALGYAIKPLDTAQLLPTIEAALARANELSELRQTREQLQQALQGDRSINIATGILMVEFRLGRQQAFQLLRDTARAKQRKLSDLASETIAAREALNLSAMPNPAER